MNFFEQINNDIKTAMKAKEKAKLETLRAVKAQLLLIKTSGSGKDEISEEESIKLLQKMVKQRKDSAEIYKSQDREELYEKEILEISFINEYLPKQISDEKLTSLISEIVKQTGASSIKEMGKVMGIASKKLAGKAEGKLIAAKVKELLG